MAHLVKANSGHLYKTPGGHLSEACAGKVCMDCEPPIPDTLYVTLAGLAGDFAPYNGKTEVNFNAAMSDIPDDECFWTDFEAWPLPDPRMVLTWQVNLNAWSVSIVILNQCDKYWVGQTGQACDPVGVYPELPDGCRWPGCVDRNSCDDSAGATCVVSLA